MSYSNHKSLAWLIFGLLAARLPFLWSPDFMPDLDETALGIHIQKWLSGIPISWYFPGQAHGFSLIEMALTAPFLLGLGPSVWALKIGMLTMFLLSMALVHQSWSKVHGWRPYTSMLVLLAMANIPPMLVWSMKLRGGYMTSLLMASLVMYLWSRRTRSIGAMVFSGAALWIMFEAHLLFAMVFLIPLITLIWWQRSEWQLKMSAWVLSGLLLGFFVVQGGKSPVNLFPPDTVHFLSGFIVPGVDLLHSILQFFSGQWLYWWVPETSFILWFPSVMVAGLVLSSVVLPNKHRWSVLGLLLIMYFFYGVFQPFPLRYFLSFWCGLMLLVPQVLGCFRERYAFVLVVLVSLIGFVKPFKHHPFAVDFPSEMRMEKVVKGWVSEMLSDEVDVVFCEDETLGYWVTYYGRQQVQGRGKAAYHRFQRDWYDGEHALRNGKAALLSRHATLGSRKGEPREGGWYYYSLVEPEELVLLGFELKSL